MFYLNSVSQLDAILGNYAHQELLFLVLFRNNFSNLSFLSQYMAFMNSKHPPVTCNVATQHLGEEHIQAVAIFGLCLALREI